MGTRGNVVVQEDGENLLRIYRQFDTYPTGMGQDLLDALNGGDVEIVHGYQMGQNVPEFFNGMGCLAAYVVAQLKDEIGNVYIQHPDREPDRTWIEYIYTLYEEGGDLYVRVDDHGETVFDDQLRRFNPEVVECGPNLERCNHVDGFHGDE